MSSYLFNSIGFDVGVTRLMISNIDVYSLLLVNLATRRKLSKGGLFLTMALRTFDEGLQRLRPSFVRRIACKPDWNHDIDLKSHLF